MKSKYKIVYFEKFCNNCQNEKTSESDEPCRECLQHPVNEDSHQPVNYKKQK
jgi:hypothetical protein